MDKSTALIEKMAAIGNAADPKTIADGKIMADVKIPAAREKQADGKIFAGVEISPPDEIPTAIEKPAEPEKSKRPAYCLGSAESPAADFSPVWLMSSRSDPRRCNESCMSSPSEEKTQAALLLWANSLPYCTGCLYRPAMPRNGSKPHCHQRSGFRLEFYLFLSNHKISNSAYKCPITEPKIRT